MPWLCLMEKIIRLCTGCTGCTGVVIARLVSLYNMSNSVWSYIHHETSRLIGEHDLESNCNMILRECRENITEMAIV